MSAEKSNVIDEHRFPFSLISEFKHGYNREITRQGDISELMDKSIGRLVFRIKGSVSANNYIEFDHLHLIGPIFYIQLCLLKPNIATFHFELVTTTNITLRVTVSTLYNGDQPRFLGRSLRLPLPSIQGWMILSIDINKILAMYCSTSASTTMRSSNPVLHTVKKIQLCSNMLVRDIVTSDKVLPSDPKYLPKELGVKPLPAAHAMQFVDILEYCATLPPKILSPEVVSDIHPASASFGKKEIRSKSTTTSTSKHKKDSPQTIINHALNNMNFNPSNVTLLQPDTSPTTAAVVTEECGFTDPISPASASSLPGVGGKGSGSPYPISNLAMYMQFSQTQSSIPSIPNLQVENIILTNDKEDIDDDDGDDDDQQKENNLLSNNKVATRMGLRDTKSIDESKVDMPVPLLQEVDLTSSSSSDALINKTQQSMVVVEVNNSVSIDNVNKFDPSFFFDTEKVPIKTSAPPTNIQPNIIGVSPASVRTMKSTGNSSVGRPNNTVSGYAESISINTITANFTTLKYSIPETPVADKLFTMERLLGYSGGPAVLLYESRLLLLATGSLLIMIDLDKENKPMPKTGLFRAFRSPSTSNSLPMLQQGDSNRYTGFKQSILRGHTQSIGLIEISEKETFMVTGETNFPNGQLILWDLREGKRLATINPHIDSVHSAAFSSDNSMLVTVGSDVRHRYQIVVWDIAALLIDKAVSINSKTSAIVAKQISEFPINRVRFSPYEEFSLVSCGRENVRFWRIRKGHLPGRPVLLNEYARGFTFVDMAFHSDAGPTPLDPKRPSVYVASNRGILLRISCQTDQIMCAYQLHPCGIRTLNIHSGYAVTGSEDNKLRLWPLDFTDFLLEAQHEGVITNIRIALDGRKLAIGTSSGTLGLLNVSEHSYNTVLRSHVGNVVQVVPRLTGAQAGQEFATVGEDNTVRIWDTSSATQLIEFSSEKDKPTCAAYHPTDQLLVCGYRSGYLRLFDTQSATAAPEIRSHQVPIVCVRYIFTKEKNESITHLPLKLLASAGMDGSIVIHNAESSDYQPIKTISYGSALINSSIYMEVSDDAELLVMGTSIVGSIAVFETREFTAYLRLSTNGTCSNLASGLNDMPTAVTQTPTHFSNDATHLMSSSTGIPLHEANKNSPDNNAAMVGSSLQAPLVGVCFSSDKLGGALIAVTDKHIISIPLNFNKSDPSVTMVVESLECINVTPGTSAFIQSLSKTIVAKKLNSWEERSTKRIDFGIPVSLTKDQYSGLLLLAVRAPIVSTSSSTGGGISKKSSQTATSDVVTTKNISRKVVVTPNAVPNTSLSSCKLSDTANAFLIIDVKHKSSSAIYPTKEKIVVSTPQLYQDLIGPVQGICPCLQSGKVITVDSHGFISIWHTKMTNLSKVKVDLSSISPGSVGVGGLDASNGSGQRRKLPIGRGISAEGSVIVKVAEAKDNIFTTNDATRSTTTSSILSTVPEVINTPNRITKDFENAVMHDPSLWSANSAVSNLNLNMEDKEEEDRNLAVAHYKINLSPDNLNNNNSSLSLSQAVINHDTRDYQTMYEENNENTMDTSVIIQALGFVNNNTVHLKNNFTNDSMLISGRSNVISPKKQVVTSKLDNPVFDKRIWLDMQSPMKSIHSYVSALEQHQHHDYEGEEVKQDLVQELDSIDLLQQQQASFMSKQQSNTSNNSNSMSTERIESKSYFEEVQAMKQSLVHVITQGNAVRPSYCQARSIMLTTNGASLIIKYENEGVHVALGFPAQISHVAAKCEVVEASLDPSGNICAALVKCYSKQIYYLVVWVLVVVAKPNVTTMNNITSDSLEWQCMGFADLGEIPIIPKEGVLANSMEAKRGSTSTSNHNSNSSNGESAVHIEWSSIEVGALVVIITLQDIQATLIHSSAKFGSNVALVKICFIPTVAIYNGTIYQEWDNRSQIIQSPISLIKNIKILPDFISMKQQNDLNMHYINILIAGESKTIMISFDIDQINTNTEAALIVWSDDLGVRGPIQAIDVVPCPLSSISGMSHDQHYPHNKKTTTSTIYNSNSNEQNAHSLSVVDTLLVVLDSCGTAKFTVFSFYTYSSEEDLLTYTIIPIARSVTVKIPAANVSGSLRTLALYPPECKQSSHFLALGSTHDIRLFTLNIRELNAKSITVNLIVLYKIALKFVPDYIHCMRPITDTSRNNNSNNSVIYTKLKQQLGPLGYAPHVLVSNELGSIGFVPNVRWITGRHLPSECLLLQSQPIGATTTSTVNHSTVQVSNMIIPSLDADIIAMLVKGQLHFYHITSGVKLEFAGYTGLSYGTSLCNMSHYTNNSNSISNSTLLFAVGSKCGEIIIIDVLSLQQQELISLSLNSINNNNNIVSMNITSTNTTISNHTKKSNLSNKSLNYTTTKTKNPSDFHKYHITRGTAVLSMYSICRGTMILAVQESGELSLIHLGTNKTSCLSSIFTPSIVRRLPLPFYQQLDSILSTNTSNSNNNVSNSENSSKVHLSSDRTYNRYQTIPIIATCAGEDRIFGIIRKHSNVLELYFEDYMPSGDVAFPRNYLNVSIKTPTDVIENSENMTSAYFPYTTNATTNTSAQGVNIIITACHIIVSDRTYVITIIGKMLPNHNDVNNNNTNINIMSEQDLYDTLQETPLYMFSGSVTLPDIPEITARKLFNYMKNKDINDHHSNNNNKGNNDMDFTPYLTTLRQRILLDECILPNNHSSNSSINICNSNHMINKYINQCNTISFHGHYCAVVTVDAIYVVDLLKVYTNPPGILLSNVCTVVIPCTVTMLGRSATWTDSSIFLTTKETGIKKDLKTEIITTNKPKKKSTSINTEPPQVSSNYIQQDQSLYDKSLQLIVSRKNKPTLLKFRIKCEN